METVRLSALELPDAVGLARSVGWGDTVGDWAALSSTARILGLRERDGALIATAALCDFGPVVSIAKMIVREDRRGLGLARRLMNECLALPRAPASVPMLIATPLGLPVYEKLGFRPVGLLSMLTGTLPRAAARSEVQPLTSIDALVRLDAEVWGCDREALVRARLSQASQAVELRVDGRLEAYGWLTRNASGLSYVGPVVAKSLAQAMAIVETLASAGQPLRIDVAENTPFAAALVAGGLVAGESRTEMTLEGRPLPGARHCRWAPLALAYG